MTTPTDPALATPAQTPENTIESASGGCQQRFVLPDCSQDVGEEGLGRFRRLILFLKEDFFGAKSDYCWIRRRDWGTFIPRIY